MSDPLFHSHFPSDTKSPGRLGKAIALIAGAILLPLAVMFSLVAVTVFVVVATLFAGWLWWKTRALRKAMREAAAVSTRAEESVIEGQFVREGTDNDRLLR